MQWMHKDMLARRWWHRTCKPSGCGDASTHGQRASSSFVVQVTVPGIGTVCSNATTAGTSGPSQLTLHAAMVVQVALSLHPPLRGEGCGRSQLQMAQAPHPWQAQRS